MCYLTTTYHTACQHYGRLTNSQPCIRARFDPNLRITGCDDATDHGVDSKNTRCPHCQWRLENPNATLTEWLPPGVPTLMLPLKNSVLDSSIKLPRASETEVRNFDGRTSRSSRSYAQPATPSEGKAVRRTEPPVLRWRTWGGPGENAISVCMSMSMRCIGCSGRLWWMALWSQRVIVGLALAGVFGFLGIAGALYF